MTKNANMRARILVVDDDQDLADALTEFLQKIGYDAVAEYGGRQALERFKTDDFQLVITDLMMPEMDGMKLLEAVKTFDKHVVVIVVTGFGTIESAVDAIKKGAYDFIAKPFEYKTLELVITRALERHTLFHRLGVFRGLAVALIISVPIWLILGIILAKTFFK